jgi:dihydroflavonol-4-reductase
MTVVVTGAAGHIGGTLARVLLGEGHSVRALVHQDRRALEGLDVEIATGDVRDPDSLCRAFEGAEVVYHSAGRISIAGSEWELLRAVNVEGPRNVVEACLRCHVRRLVHFSSIHAFQQEPLDVPIDESRPLVSSPGCGPYDLSKAEGERVVRRGIERGLDAVILNPTGVIGPYDYRVSRIGYVLLSLSRGRLPALVPGGFDWVDVRDVAAGAVRAAERATSGARYLLSGHWVSVRDLATTAEAITGVPAPRWTCPTGLARFGAPLATAYSRLVGQQPVFSRGALDALSANCQISHEQATHDLDYDPRPFEETMYDSYRWFQEAGYLPASVTVRSPEVA